MNDLTLIIIAGIFIFLFWGPHSKHPKPKDDKDGKDGKKGGDKKEGEKKH